MAKREEDGKLVFGRKRLEAPGGPHPRLFGRVRGDVFQKTLSDLHGALLLLIFGPGALDDLLAQVRGDFLVVGELHGEHAPVARYAPQVCGVGKDLGHGHYGLDGLAPGPGLGAEYLSPPRVYIPYDVSEVLL